MPADPLQLAAEPEVPVPAGPPLLATKLHAPALRGHRVHRPRLFDRLDAGSGSALSLISAPAGFGKSTLVSDWLRERERAAAWLSLDPADSDLRRFLSYFTAALGRCLPGVGSSLTAVLAAPRLPEPEPLLTPLVNELWESPGCTLVLDDYHVIEAPEVHEALAFFLERLPPGMHLVMATRTDPPLPLPRLRARNLLCELRAEDLRFTSEEAAAFLRDSMGLDVTAREVEALERRTEGWIAGLQMAALSLRGRDDVSALIAGFTGSHRFVLDYLTEEVLDLQPPDRLEFLLRTAILGRLSGSLCDAVTGRADGQDVLESLETANLFLIPLDDTRRWYRYHHLFASLLQDELRRRVGKGDLADLHRRASDWFAGHGLPDEAVDHAVTAGDFERAAAIVEAHANRTMHRGHIGTVARWFALLPEDCYRTRPRLLIDRAIMLFASFRIPELIAVMAELEQAAAASDDPVLAAGRDGMQAVILSGRGDQEGVVVFAGRSLENLPADAPEMRGLVTLVLGMALARTSRTARALEVLEEAAALNLAVGNLATAVVSRANQGLVEALHGNLRRSLERHQQALGLVAPLGDAALPAAALAFEGTAEVHLERGDLDLALDDALTSTRLSRTAEIIGYHLRGLSCLVQVRIARREFAAAREVFAELDALMSRAQLPIWEVPIQCLGIRIDVVEGWLENRPDLLAKAGRWAEDRGLLSGWDRLRERMMPDLPRDHIQLTVGHLLVATGRFDEALGLLAALRLLAEEEGWVRSQIEVAVLEALARRGKGDKEAAESLARALDLAEPEGFLQIFASVGPGLAPLLAEVERSRPGRLDGAFGRRLRSVLAPGEIPTPAPARPLQPASTEETLSERELEVLRAVSSGLSNSEAARRLYLSPFTVKKHLENIYGKLGVRNRTEAIARAQAQGWLAPPGPVIG